MTNNLSAEKHSVLIHLLSLGSIVTLYLDPRHPRCLVPERFTKQPVLRLEIGLNMRIPIPDLRLTNEGVMATLSFDQKPFSCFLPFDAIGIAHDEDNIGQVWKSMQTSVPAEKKANRGHLKLVVNNG